MFGNDNTISETTDEKPEDDHDETEEPDNQSSIRIIEY